MYITIQKTQRIEPSVAVQKSAPFLAADSKCGLRRLPCRRATDACNPRHFVGLRPTIGWRENIDTS
jgi:hypothetical protein